MWLLHCTHNKPLSDWQNQYLAIALACVHSGGSVCSTRHASQFYKHNVRSREKRPVFWLMSPWQLHNSWIVLVIHFSFANQNSGCVFAEGWLESVFCTHTLKSNPYRKCWRSLVLIWEAGVLWKPPVLYEGPLASSTLRSAHLESCMLIHPLHPPVCLSIGPRWLYTDAIWCNSERSEGRFSLKRQGRSFAIRSMTGFTQKP